MHAWWRACFAIPAPAATSCSLLLPCLLSAGAGAAAAAAANAAVAAVTAAAAAPAVGNLTPAWNVCVRPAVVNFRVPRFRWYSTQAASETDCTAADYWLSFKNPELLADMLTVQEVPAAVDANGTYLCTVRTKIHGLYP
jgi:hypothetical protein